MKLLSIIIPRYNETELELFPLLSSINNQVGIDFTQLEIIIVDDCSKRQLDMDFLRLFQNININQVQLLQNGGPGVARQAGIDEARGEYLLFCDADDLLHNIAVLGVYFEAINTTTEDQEYEHERYQWDIIATDWLEELLVNNQIVYIPHTQESTWMHGKCIRRTYLRDKNIRFHPDFRVHEDSYFLSLAYSKTKLVKFIPVTTYLWRFNPNSITRRNEAEYTFNTMPDHCRAIVESFKVLDEILPIEAMMYRIAQYTYYMFFLTHREEWAMDERKQWAETLTTMFVKEITPLFDKYYHQIPKEMLSTIYTEERAKNFQNQIESETIEQWLYRIGLK